MQEAQEKLFQVMEIARSVHQTVLPVWVRRCIKGDSEGYSPRLCLLLTADGSYRGSWRNARERKEVGEGLLETQPFARDVSYENHTLRYFCSRMFRTAYS